MKKIIKTLKAPTPIGPYSQAVVAGNLLFVSGQIAINPATGNLEADSVTTETHQVMQNLKAILSEAGIGFQNVVKTTIFLMDMADFAVVNGIYGNYFSSEFPARETVQVAGLPKGVRVEISAVAVVG
jgi:2-iminobutanoate/2-iminopropanoate deaminase